jgi:AmiR/NasT family two-component response regulator
MSTVRQAVWVPQSVFAKRVLVVDADQKEWEPRTRLLIARGLLIHRISRIAEAPPRWPPHLYDLVLLRADDPAQPDIADFCQCLKRASPPVPVAFLISGSDLPGEAAVIRTDRPGPEIVDAIAQLLERS